MNFPHCLAGHLVKAKNGETFWVQGDSKTFSVSVLVPELNYRGQVRLIPRRDIVEDLGVAPCPFAGVAP